MPDPDYVTEELEQASTALADAEILEDGKGSDTAVVNRLYYACFHAAQAVLYAKGFDPTSHRGVSTLFGKEVVLKEEVPRDDGRFLSELWDYREQADYGYDTLDVDLTTLRARTETFVARMSDLVGELEDEE
ncbi:HEPN domain-containing protein [Halorussus halophilus]|uniref:HEPN domain-containing protein n=1 Tax=Halorussus halophilus TaxID=2650975 RepID=UPI00130148EB|nr:HEPN domain-containing protein [Halorussus halophilus]